MVSECPKCGGKLTEEHPPWINIAVLALVVLAFFTGGLSLLVAGALYFLRKANRFWQCKACGYTFKPHS